MSEITELKSICSVIKRGIAPKYTENGGVLVINQRCIRDGRILYENARQNDITKKKIPDERKLISGDVLINSTGVGTLGRVSQIYPSTQMTVDSHVTIVRANPAHVDLSFFGYYLKFLQPSFEAAGEGSTGQTELARDRIGEHKIRLPTKAEQIMIGQLLLSVDDKIENNRRMNETLEEMARAIFKSWFVDFDPVHAKAAGNTPAHMDAETVALFPSSFSDDGLPVGWSLGQLSDLVDLNPTERIKKGELSSYVEMANLPTSGSNISNVVLREFKSGTKFRNGDTLLARITPCLENGKTAYVDVLNEGEVAWGSTEYIVMRTKDPLPKFYSYVLARSEHFREHAIRSMTGTSGRQRAQADMVAAYEVVIPSNQVAFAFSEKCQNWFSKIRCNASENQILAELRDTLLPKLMSGEIRVKDSEREVEAAV
jgi:type I restriction enzyme, S subunit